MKDRDLGQDDADTARVEQKANPKAKLKHLTIEELLEGIPEGTCLGEYDWGPARGAEFW